MRHGLGGDSVCLHVNKQKRQCSGIVRCEMCEFACVRTISRCLIDSTSKGLSLAAQVSDGGFPRSVCEAIKCGGFPWYEIACRVERSRDRV